MLVLTVCLCVLKENDIFLGWEKGTGKKWGKSKKKGGTDLSLEEMKKQAAVQCLRSASDEVSVTVKPDSVYGTDPGFIKSHISV